jgi:methylase of polypeptide subunit release factors
LRYDESLNTATRRAGGVFYSGEEEIDKVIDPLFIGELRALGRENKEDMLARIRSATFLDPACGSGNFLVATIAALQELELEVGAEPQAAMSQCYGIEIDPISAGLARGTGANITTADALDIDWNDVLPAERCTYIIGNPPYIGSNNASPTQKAQLKRLAKTTDIDYACAWFIKAADYMRGETKLAFVTTNSVTQGTQVPVLFPLLYARGLELIFARRSFPWKGAAVHVVVLGLCREEFAPTIRPIFP